jgi:hypothetical protein
VRDIRGFIDEYFGAWQGTDEDQILSHYAETVSVEIPAMFMNGRAALRDQFVRPFIAGFPGNLTLLRTCFSGKTKDHLGPHLFRGRDTTQTDFITPASGAAGQTDIVVCFADNFKLQEHAAKLCTFLT